MDWMYADFIASVWFINMKNKSIFWGFKKKRADKSEYWNIVEYMTDNAAQYMSFLEIMFYKYLSIWCQRPFKKKMYFVMDKPLDSKVTA